MAVGDRIVGGISNASSYTHYYIQPASGETWVLYHFFGDFRTDMGSSYEELTDEDYVSQLDLRLRDSGTTIYGYVMQTEGYLFWRKPYYLVIDNTVYIDWYNEIGNPFDLYWSGVITNDSASTSDVGLSQSMTFDMGSSAYTYTYVQPASGEVWALSTFGPGVSRTSVWQGTLPNTYQRYVGIQFYSSGNYLELQNSNTGMPPAFRGDAMFNTGWYFFDNTNHIRIYSHLAGYDCALSIMQVT